MKRIKAKDIMTTDVLVASAEWSLERLTEFFVENSISGAPVTSEDGKLIGVVSLTDIVVKGAMQARNFQSEGPHEYYLKELERQYGRQEMGSFQVVDEPLVIVREIMTPMIFKVNEDTVVKKVADIMIRNRIHRVFVTREEELVGVIATPDMLKIIRDM